MQTSKHPSLKKKERKKQDLFIPLLFFQFDLSLESKIENEREKVQIAVICLSGEKKPASPARPTAKKINISL